MRLELGEIGQLLPIPEVEGELQVFEAFAGGATFSSPRMVSAWPGKVQT
jgi:hypothetical protein